jgi:hypothetical protein
VEDTSVMTGNGLNNLGGPIAKNTPVGLFRKEPGSRTWTLFKPPTLAERRAQREKERRESVARRGHLPMDVVIGVDDTTIAARLRDMGIPTCDAPPCTAGVTIPYRQVDSLRQLRIPCWQKGQRRPDSERDPRGSRGDGLLPGRRQGLSFPPSEPESYPGGPSVASVTVFSDNFETYAVPGYNWSADDYDSFSGYDFWGTTTCDRFGGSYSVHCAEYDDPPGSLPCNAYDADQDAVLAQNAPVPVSAYPSWAVQISAKYSINDYYGSTCAQAYDYLEIYFDFGDGFGLQLWDCRFGNSNGWTPLSYIFVGGYNSVQMAFRFVSDGTVQSGIGVFLDNITVVGSQPNLTYYTPAGWPAPIVPSSASSSTLYTGEATYLDWAIWNNGDANATHGFDVDFLVYDTNGTTLLSDLYRTVPSLSQNATWIRYDDITFTVNSPGTHKIRMVVDSLPYSQVAESNETPADNGVTRTYTWVNRANLVIDNVTVTPPHPLVGQTVDIAATIRNGGTENISGTFYTDEYDNPIPAPSPPCPGGGNATSSTFGLSGGASTTLHFYRTSNVTATWSTYLYADRSCAVIESNENDNRYGPVTIPWTAGNIAISGRFVYDDPLGTTNQPVRCMRVQIYDYDPGNPRDLQANTYTDEQGYFGPVNLVNEDTNYDHGLLDVFIEGIYETSPSCRATSAVTVVGPEVNTWWAYDSARRDDITNGDFGTIKPTAIDHRSALHIYNIILRGYDWVSARGTTMPHVTMQWFVGNPEKTHYDTLPPIIQVSGQYAQPYADAPDELDDGVLLHEYGHHSGVHAEFDASDCLHWSGVPRIAAARRLCLERGVRRLLCGPYDTQQPCLTLAESGATQLEPGRYDSAERWSRERRRHRRLSARLQLLQHE